MKVARTSTLYNHYIVQSFKSKRKKILQNQSLKRFAVFGAGGEIHGHLGTLVLLQEDGGVANHAENSLYIVNYIDRTNFTK